MLAMQLQPEAETTQPTPVATQSFSEWLEDLAAGECGWETMFRGVLPVVNANPDAGWELLALVDQHYRLHRITEDDFHALNSSLQAVLLDTHGCRGRESGGDGSGTPCGNQPAAEQARCAECAAHSETCGPRAQT